MSEVIIEKDKYKDMILELWKETLIYESKVRSFYLSGFLDKRSATNFASNLIILAREILPKLKGKDIYKKIKEKLEFLELKPLDKKTLRLYLELSNLVREGLEEAGFTSGKTEIKKVI